MKSLSFYDQCTITAMMTLLRGSSHDVSEEVINHIAQNSFKMADAMVAERNRPATLRNQTLICPELRQANIYDFDVGQLYWFKSHQDENMNPIIVQLISYDRVFPFRREGIDDSLKFYVKALDWPEGRYVSTEDLFVEK